MKEINMNLKNVGFSNKIADEAALYEGLFPARVSRENKGFYKVVTSEGECLAEISGKMHYETQSLEDFPAVGDFVMVDRESDKQGNIIIHHVLKRNSIFARRSSGTNKDVQVIAANIDTVFLCMSLNSDFNIRRIERYLTIAWESGAIPIIVLTKSDLCENIEEKMAELHLVAIGVDVIVTSALDKNRYSELMNYITEGKTIAFIGSSGVGKSTLINKLAGYDVLKTNDIRESDDKGKHTTTYRQLIALENGAILIDTPGMREIGISTGNANKTFAEIEELALECKFHDCTHTQEPGCAVQNAIAEGMITVDRLESYKKLLREIEYSTLNSRELENKKIEKMFGSKGEMKQVLKQIKNKNRR